MSSLIASFRFAAGHQLRAAIAFAMLALFAAPNQLEIPMPKE